MNTCNIRKRLVDILAGNDKFKFFAENNSFFREVCIPEFFLKILPEIWDKKFKMHTRNECFLKMLGKNVSEVRALFIPTASIDAEAIEVLPKCIHDLSKCGIQNRNIKVFDLHTGMGLDELQQYDVVYLCGGSTSYLLERINSTGFHMTLMDYIYANGMVIGVSAGSLDVHCPDGLEIIGG